MQKVAGSITYKGAFKTEELGVNVILNDIEFGVYNAYVYGETEITSSKEFVKILKKRIKGDLLNFDISISSEDKIKIFEPKTDGKYILRTSEGESFEDVVETKKGPNIISIREAEPSKTLGGKVIKIDYIVQ